MLVDFKVSNFRSFKDEQDFSMETGERLRKYNDTNTIKIGNNKLLKAALIFGANANGKTNLLQALSMLKFLITKPTNDELQNLRVDTFGYNNHDTMFDITFIKEETEFNYHLEYNANEVMKEELIVNDDLIFSRDRQSFLKVPKQLEPIIDNIRKNQLLLYFAQQNNEFNSKQAYKWFVEDLIFVNTESIANAKFEMLKDHAFKERFLHFMQAADFNIIDIDVQERMVPTPMAIVKGLGMKIKDADDADTDSGVTKILDVYSKHKSSNGSFDVYFDNESTGTKVFMFLALFILSNYKKTLLIDEFDKSYHLELAQALLCLINSNGQSNQFILTTHELSLMDCKLRQDQIWFAEKNRFGESKLFSLFDFDDPALKRSDFNYKKRYLAGLYGATQIVNKRLLMEALGNNE